MRRLPEGSIDAIITDPPYGVAYRGFSRKYPLMVNDDRTDWFEAAFAGMFRVLAADSFIVSFYGWPTAEAFLAAWRRAGFRPVAHLVAVKNMIGLGSITRSRHESAYVLAKGRPRPTVVRPDVLSFIRERHYLHPTQKPLGLMEELVTRFSPPGGLVLDPFMGSGSTGVAAVRTGRRFLGMEIEPRFVEIARERIAEALRDRRHRTSSPTSGAVPSASRIRAGGAR